MICHYLEIGFGALSHGDCSELHNILLLWSTWSLFILTNTIMWMFHLVWILDLQLLESGLAFE